MSIQIGATISQAWSLVKGSKRVFICVFFVLLVLQSILLGVQEEMNIVYHQAPGVHAVFTILMIFLSSPLMAGFAMLGLQRARGKTLKVKSSFLYYKQIFPIFSVYFIGLACTWIVMLILIAIVLSIFMLMGQAHLLTHVAARIGTVSVLALICVLGLMAVNMLFSFSYFFLLDAGERFHTAVWSSVKMVWANFKKMYGLLIVLSLLNTLGIIPFGLGLIWTLPLSYIAIAVAYERLSTH
jgi:hypothetical protein